MLVRDPHFTVVLEGDWLERPSPDDEQKTYHSRSLDTLVVMSSIAVDVLPERLEEAAHILVDLRMKAENEASIVYGVFTTIVEPIVVPQPWGYSVAYCGSDDSGRQFTYGGMVTPSAVINIYGESPSASEQGLATTMRALLTDLEFVRN